uniref:VRK serine/threonine kinase 3 n=1 Tax=Oncorhynchus mykiss TaxID=8022 RepID=A0A8C7V2X8_ONCMY
MLFHFCPQCGTKLQPGFRFCPSCGDKLQCVVDPSGPVEVASSGVSQLHVTDGVIMTANASSPTPSTAQLTGWDTGGLVCATPSPVSTRPPLHRTCNSVPVAWSEEAPSSITSPPVTAPLKHTADQSHKSVLSPRKRHALTPKEEQSVELTSSPCFSPLPGSPSTVQQNGQGANSSDYKHILKLGAKDGKMFNEQNFLQRAAKPSSVDKWIKHAKMDFLGIPSCVGFGLHADSYRFLIFSSMGQTLQSFMDEGEGLLSEKAVLQLACRVLDVLEFIHENEYVHADIHAENIYISPAQQTQVNLAGYCHAFRYSPGGRHVEYREGSRTPNEGAIDFISLESHKGAGPSRRSDLQALGYCMLRWYTGALPWTSLTHTPARVATEKERYMEDVPGLLSHCFGQKKVSSALQVYLSQVMALQYSDQPDYRALRAGLRAALQKLGGSLEQPLDLQMKAI